MLFPFCDQLAVTMRKINARVLLSVSVLGRALSSPSALPILSCTGTTGSQVFELKAYVGFQDACFIFG